MLTINGLRLIKNNYSAKHTSNDNHKRAHFQSQVDTFAFKGASSVARKTSESLDDIVLQVQARYSDVLGENFKKAFLKPLKDFTNQQEATLFPYNENQLVEMPTDRQLRFSGRVKAGTAIKLLSWGHQIHNDPIVGLTKNEAFVLITDELLSGRLKLYDWNIPLNHFEVPQDLKAKTAKIKSALTELTERWLDTPYGNSHDKVKALQNAYRTLMPEIETKEFYEI